MGAQDQARWMEYKKKGQELKWGCVNGNREEEQELWPGVPGFFSASRNSRMKENQN